MSKLGFHLEDGRLIIEDLDLEAARVLAAMGIGLPPVSPASSILPLGMPRWRALCTRLVSDPLPNDREQLRVLHDQMMSDTFPVEAPGAEAHSMLTLKKALWRAEIDAGCQLCGHACDGRKRLCPIASRRPVGLDSCFLHLGEEAEIGESIAFTFSGCNLWCKFCQKGDSALASSFGDRQPFGPNCWEKVRTVAGGSLSSISFLGGNPDQALGSIVDFLSCAPLWAADVPIVWHTNGYSKAPFLRILRGIPDVIVYDFKFFTNRCAAKLTLSAAQQYIETAAAGLDVLAGETDGPAVIVRHLVLPGHEDCCTRPLLRHLAALPNRNRLLVNIMGQYMPAFRMLKSKGAMSAPISRKVVGKLRYEAKNLGLRLVISRDSIDEF